MALTAEQIIENRKKLAAALRSGEWQQGKGELFCQNGNRCCLGVAIHVLRPSEPVTPGSSYLPGGDWAYTIVQEGMGLGVGHRAMFMDANDRQGKSFAEIADMVDALPAPEVTP